MKRSRNTVKFSGRPLRWLALLAIYAVIALAVGLGWLYHSIPDTIYVEKGNEIQFARFPYLSAKSESDNTRAVSTAEAGSYHTILAVGGILPIKEVRTIVTERPVVTVCGTPFGIKMFSDGALVVGFSDLYTENGQANPAKEAGLKLGDLIVSVDGVATRSNEELKAVIEQAQGKDVSVVYVRDDAQYTVQLTPIRDEAGQWKAGMWVRDSSAGVGTLTFVDEKIGVFAGLGHSINDSDTGKSITLRSGEIVPCEITGFTAGGIGAPGELKGKFVGLHAVGSIMINGATGVYGTTRTAFSGRQAEVAFSQEVTVGPATLLTTIDGTQPKAYTIEIERLNLAGEDENRNLVIRVTDRQLLEATGGIVQGMSGSPILQNGRLVGAVTHVLVNDPTRGYGIFAQTMLEQAEQVANVVKEAA